MYESCAYVFFIMSAKELVFRCIENVGRNYLVQSEESKGIINVKDVNSETHEMSINDTQTNPRDECY